MLRMDYKTGIIKTYYSIIIPILLTFLKSKHISPITGFHRFGHFENITHHLNLFLTMANKSGMARDIMIIPRMTYTSSE